MSAANSNTSGAKVTTNPIDLFGSTDNSTGDRAKIKQQQLGKREPKSRVKASKLFAEYKPGGAVVSYADNKVGVLPNLDAVLEEIANEAGIDLSDPSSAAGFLDAIVTDVYVNAYSDQQAFEGEIVVRDGTFVLPRRYVKAVLSKYVGTMFRRFARAVAPLVVEIMHDNPDYAVILDKRATELGLSTRAEAAMAFDGADALTTVSREAARRNAEAKAIALSRRPTNRSYSLANSAANTGERDYEPGVGVTHGGRVMSPAY